MHNISATSNSEVKTEMNERKTYNIELIKTRFEKSLGRETSDLILKTLKLFYKIDEETIVANPELFEEKLGKMLGTSVAEVILKN